MKATSIAYRSRGERLAALIWIIVMACANNHGRSKDEWARARTVVEHYLRDKYGSSWSIREERHGVPFMFKVQAANEASVLVHDNAVFTQRGLGALDSYLRESRCVEQQLPSVRELTILLNLLDALPPEPNARSYYNDVSSRKEWAPQLEYLDGGRAQLHLYYSIDPDPDSQDAGEGEQTESSLREWTLKMDPGQMPVWTSMIREWDRVKEQWVVDHTN